VLAGCIRRHAPDLDEALARYEDARRPVTAAIVAANRGLGPERPMLLVEQRAPAGFDEISAVIMPEEIAAVTEEYRRVAGFAVSDLQRGVSLLNEPY
jgi:5-methylphenazine-1-carboxylate 1-monooxygenase